MIETIFNVFMCVFGICIMFLIAPTMQLKLYEVNPDFFCRIKIKKLSFLFRGIGVKGCVYRDVKEYGIALPMFVLQVTGYVVAMFSIIVAVLLCFIFNFELKTVGIIIYIIFGCYAIILVSITSITIFISKKREKKSK